LTVALKCLAFSVIRQEWNRTRRYVGHVPFARSKAMIEV
jgi:hypothetical protein